MTVLMAHLNEARRPVQSMLGRRQAPDRRVGAQDLELSRSSTEDNRTLRAAWSARVARSRSANSSFAAWNAARATTRMRSGGFRRASKDWAPRRQLQRAASSAECARSSSGSTATHRHAPLARRTRIGRAPGCELQIDSSSVSRHHALLLKSARELIIEDLNSTNGVIVNGRKISRQLLKDGDLLTIGEVQLRCSLKSVPPPGGRARA